MKQVVADVVNAVKGIWNDLIGFFARAGADMWRPLETAFKAVMNGIARAWNATIGKISVHVPSWVPGLGGKGFDVPNIPTLAQGGIVTQTGLILAHAGEAISPIPRGAMGPAVHIENANFATELDVDAFMRRAAFVAQNAGI